MKRIWQARCSNPSGTHVWLRWVGLVVRGESQSTERLSYVGDVAPRLAFQMGQRAKIQMSGMEESRTQNGGASNSFGAEAGFWWMGRSAGRGTN